MQTTKLKSIRTGQIFEVSEDELSDFGADVAAGEIVVVYPDIKPESLKVGSVIRNQYGEWAVREIKPYGWSIQGDSGMIALFEGELRFYQLVKY